MYSISENDRLFLLDYFNNNTEKYVYTMGMIKIPVLGSDEIVINLIKDIISRQLNIKNFILLGDNFFKHSLSYFPHCDASEVNAWMNILIPLDLPMPGQKFIIFDQIWKGPPTTWFGNFKISADFLNNKKTNSRPFDSAFLENKIDNELEEEIYQHIGNHFLTKEYLYGLSGKVIDWIPGKVITFDSRQIHMTGKMSSPYKIGLSVRIGKL